MQTMIHIIQILKWHLLQSGGCALSRTERIHARIQYQKYCTSIQSWLLFHLMDIICFHGDFGHPVKNNCVISPIRLHINIHTQIIRVHWAWRYFHMYWIHVHIYFTYSGEHPCEVNEWLWNGVDVKWMVCSLSNATSWWWCDTWPSTLEVAIFWFNPKCLPTSVGRNLGLTQIFPAANLSHVG